MKNKHLQIVAIKMATENEEHSQRMAELHTEASAIFAEHMLAHTEVLKKLESDLDKSEDLGYFDDEFAMQWVRFKPSALIEIGDEMQERLLKAYLADNYFIYLDLENDAAMRSLGPAIVISKEGDVLDQDSGKWFLSKNNYSCTEDRNAQIEKYMEKTGHFPSVLQESGYGDVRFVNTLKAKVQNDT